MKITGEMITFILFVMALAGALWKIFNFLSGMKDELKTDIWKVRESLEKKDQSLESLHDKTVLGVTQLREKIDHNTTRLRDEIKEIKMRLNDVEGFLIKSTDYKERDYGNSPSARSEARER